MSAVPLIPSWMVDLTIEEITLVKKCMRVSYHFGVPFSTKMLRGKGIAKLLRRKRKK